MCCIPRWSSFYLLSVGLSTWVQGQLASLGWTRPLWGPMGKEVSRSSPRSCPCWEVLTEPKAREQELLMGLCERGWILFLFFSLTIQISPLCPVPSESCITKKKKKKKALSNLQGLESCFSAMEWGSSSTHPNFSISWMCLHIVS